MLQKNDVFDIQEGDSFHVENFPKQFLCDNGDLDFFPTTGVVSVSGLIRGLDTAMFVGEWVVTSISLEPAGVSDPSHRDYGHLPVDKVYARKIVELFSGRKELSKLEIWFYQGNRTGRIGTINREPKRKVEIHEVVV